MYTLLENNAAPSAKEVEQTFDGILFRCAGYRPILQLSASFQLAALAVARARVCQDLLPCYPTRARLCISATPRQAKSAIDPSRSPTCQRPRLLRLWLQCPCRRCAGAMGVVKYLTVKPYCTNIVLIHLNFLPNLATCSSDASGLTIGSTVSIAEVTSQLEQAETAAFQENAEHIKRVASVQILSVAS